MSSFADILTTVQQDDDDIDIDIDVDVSVPPPHMQSSMPEETSMDTTVAPERSPDEIRGEALNLRGVDDLSTREVKLFVDHYIKPGYTFATRDQFAKFDSRLEWINDTSLNVVFETEEAAVEALAMLIQGDSQLDSNEEQECKPFVRASPTVGDAPAEDLDVKLFVRRATYGDVKVKGAKQYSRYYLLHGEPDDDQRIGRSKKNYYENYLGKKNGDAPIPSGPRRNNYRDREDDRRYRSRWAGTEDLITGERDTNAPAHEGDKITLGDDDLFAGKTVTKLSRPLSERGSESRWEHDRHPGRSSNRRSGRGRSRHRSRSREDDDLLPNFRERELSPERR